jgi:hypothetical protein
VVVANFVFVVVPWIWPAGLVAHFWAGFQTSFRGAMYDAHEDVVTTLPSQGEPTTPRDVELHDPFGIVDLSAGSRNNLQ